MMMRHHDKDSNSYESSTDAYWSMLLQDCWVQRRLDGGYNIGFLEENGGGNKNVTVLSFLLSLILNTETHHL